ncbi:MAG: cbb3-type cytochrome c oxidase subunit I [Caldisphaera sp.]|nr:cbb3-type cytochrome c oxidase subunit I [Caldisphaera sp.]
MIGAIFAVGIPLIIYIIKELISHWNDPIVKIDLPKPNKTQKLALWVMLIATLGSGVQGLLGAYVMHLYSTGILYGLNLLSILPFNVARGLHIWLAIYWISLTWVIFSLFVLPYFGLNISRKTMITIIILGILTALGSLFGLWASYLQLIPSPWWFIFGAQGRDVIEVGSFWLLLITALLGYVSYLFYKASKLTVDLLKPFAKVLSYLLAGDAIGIFVGALPIVKPFPYFTEDEFFRWIFVHANVEGFWPGIVIAVLALLLVLQGLIPAGLAKTVITIDAVTEVLTGMIGTAHHYYWTGFPVIWMYIGAILSVLEAIPLGMAMGYVILAARRNKGNNLNQFQKTLITFVLAAGIGGSAGVIVFGAGLINAPIINYFTHDLQFTMAHAHLAFPLAYGLPTILMWVVTYTLSGGFTERDLKYLGISSIIYTVGFYLQALISLLPLGILQWIYELKYGFWYIKTVATPNGKTGFWNLQIVQNLIWLRMIGDLVAASAIAVIILLMLIRFPRSIKG